MENQPAANESPAPAQLAVSLARNVSEVRSAQRLRYRVFAGEMGARVPGREQGVDCDVFDAYCDHLIVRDTATGEVVGTYRLLPWARARRAGGFYAQREFDLSRVSELLPYTVEAGRACVHPDYRGGAVLTQLWGGIVDYVRRSEAHYVMGCASVSLADGGRAAGAVHAALQDLGVTGPRVTPLKAYRLRREATSGDGSAALAPLIRTYLRLGASVCAAPAWDPHFNTADYFVMLSMARLTGPYARRLAQRLPAAFSPATAAA